ncbi:MAG: alpha/beta fold hydrolase [Casimicrobiaceae bacterium]
MSAKQVPFDPADGWPERGVSILNGMLGDYLQKRGNDLAIAMSFRHQGQPLELTPAGLRAAHATLTGKVCVLVHGYCCNESVWTFPGSAAPGTSYGSRLQRDLGYTPFYVRYNTGLPIQENGAHLSRLLHDLAAAYPTPIVDIALVGHSMGGLLMRSACDSARTEAGNWLGSVKRAVYIGTPHDGADLERFARMTTGTLRAIPTHVTRLIGDILNLRSRGVKDLAAGHLQAENEAQPWLASARHHLLMGTLTRDPEHPVGRIFGDALVRVPRAAAPTAGQASSPDVIVFPGVHHLALAHDESVYRCIRQICAGE